MNRQHKDDKGRDPTGAERALNGELRRVLLWVAAVFIGYLVVAQVAILAAPPLVSAVGHDSLQAAEIMAMLSGAVTAAALTSVFVQLRGARQDVERRERQRQRDAMLRADELHAEFNTPDMRANRYAAYEYLRDLKDSEPRMASLAKSWLHNQWVGPETEVCVIRGDKVVSPRELSTSLSCMVAFFTRVEMNVRGHSVASHTDRDILDAIGPFFWQQWVDIGLLQLVEACESVHRTDFSSKPKPYFIDRLRALDLVWNGAVTVGDSKASKAT